MQQAQQARVSQGQEKSQNLRIRNQRAHRRFPCACAFAKNTQAELHAPCAHARLKQQAPACAQGPRDRPARALAVNQRSDGSNMAQHANALHPYSSPLPAEQGSIAAPAGDRRAQMVGDRVRVGAVLCTRRLCT